MFSFLFATGMWLSKVAQPLYFESQGALAAFGAGYATMAIVGGFSVVWGAIADRLGGLTVVRIGTLLYAVGLGGRVYTDMAPTIAFSALAGAGASLALVGIRPWVRSTASENEIPRVVAGRNLGNQTGTVAGTLAAAGIFAVATAGSDGPRIALIAAPAVIAVAAIWLLFGTQPAGRWREPDGTAQREPGRAWLCTKLIIIGLISGFYVSLLVPYLPLVLTAAGASASAAAVAVGAMSCAQIAATAVLTKRPPQSKPIRLFFLAELTTGLLTLLAGLALQLPPILLAAILICRAACVAIAVAAEEVIQYAVIPASASGLIFGASQTAFLIGDASGGALGAQIWSNAGPSTLLFVGGAITIANAALVPLLLRRETQS